MKRILVFVLLLMTLAPNSVSAVNTNNFYFSDFTGDYYLTHDADGTSRLKVKESVTAVFPDYNQNKGICRQIPFTNQGGENVVLPSLTRADVTLTRNGLPEPIYSIDKYNDYYSVCTGDESYVLGEQTYVFEYSFTHVVTEFDEESRIFQELYWDANGNGATQRFDSVTARLHFDNIDNWSGKSWCYVGKYGENGQDRCEITKIDDGVQFRSENLSSYETLTFDVELKAGSFKIPEPTKDYSLVIIAVIVTLICLIYILKKVRNFMKVSDKRKYYKGYFVKPEYQPSKDYSLAELTEIYIGDKKDYKVPMLLKMIVDKNIELVKEGKSKWNILVKKITSIDTEYVNLLAILNNGKKPEENDNIKLERHYATSKLVSLQHSIDSKVTSDLKKDGLVEKDYKNGSAIVGAVIGIIVAVMVFQFVGILGFNEISDLIGGDGVGTIKVFKEHFMLYMIVLIAITMVARIVLELNTEKYKNRTMKGLEVSRFMDGLKMYISMAEADRIKLLQSVDGADVSPEGIVKLYEKLLPYAAIFGLEKSWMNEMKEYCELAEVESTTSTVLSSIAVNDLYRVVSTASTYASNATTMSSSSASSSSSYSGGGGFSGGGGGFSGGGGGGGGFSGR